MFFTNLRRITRSAVANFWRSKMVSISSILVMTITLFVFGSLVFSNAALDFALEQIKGKVDINVYFVTNAVEEDIMSLKGTLENLPEVESVEYVSREQALENFKERHKDDQLTLQAVEELEDNPLGAMLNIHAKETSQYEAIANFLNSSDTLSSDGSNIIDKINYYQNKVVIERLSKLVSATEKVGSLITLALVAISIMITYNTVRLAIFISRDEIAVMRLVGASSKYVRGPFIVEGVIYGLVSAVITLILFFPLTYYMDPLVDKIFGMSIWSYYLGNWFKIFFMMCASGITVGAISSFLAVRKYLKV